MIEQGSSYDGPRTTGPEALARLGMPILLLRGARSNVADWYHACVAHVAAHAPHAEVRGLAELGHLGPMVAPAPVADEITRFLDRVDARV